MQVDERLVSREPVETSGLLVVELLCSQEDNKSTLKHNTVCSEWTTFLAYGEVDATCFDSL